MPLPQRSFVFKQVVFWASNVEYIVLTQFSLWDKVEKSPQCGQALKFPFKTLAPKVPSYGKVHRNQGIALYAIIISGDLNLSYDV